MELNYQIAARYFCSGVLVQHIRDSTSKNTFSNGINLLYAGWRVINLMHFLLEKKHKTAQTAQSAERDKIENLRKYVYCLHAIFQASIALYVLFSQLRPPLANGRFCTLLSNICYSVSLITDLAFIAVGQYEAGFSGLAGRGMAKLMKA